MQREIKGPQTRATTFDRQTVDLEARTVQIAISSEAPVERWFGTEILDHSARSVDLSRLSDGGPLLLNHDHTDQIGVIHSVSLDGDRVLRGVVRFSRSARAEEIFQDVVDGIRTKISVGYSINDYETTKGQNGAPDTIRATNWQPMEVSFVSVPADMRVGVGRSLEADTAPEPTPAPAPVTTEVRMSDVNPGAGQAPNAQETATRERLETVHLLGVASSFGLREKAEGLLATDKPLAEVRAELMRDMAGKQPVLNAPKPEALVDLTEAEQKRYSISRALMAHAEKRDSFEMEVSREIAKKLGRDTSGFFVPTVGAKIAGSRANPPMDTATAAYGQKLVYTERGEFIELLRNKITVMGLGARMLPGLRGNVALPRQTAANTATWTAENPGSAVTATALQTDQVTLSPKQLLAQTSLTRTLLAQATPEADALIMDDLALVHAIAIDAAAINGSGTPAPTGILNTAGIGSVAGGTNGAQPTYGNIVDLESAVAVANADLGALAYLTTPAIRGRLKQTQQFSGTNGASVWEYLMGAYGNSTVSNNVPSNLTKGTSSGICHAIIFGNFNELLIGDWGAFEVITDPYTQAGKGLVVVTSVQLADVQVRHAASFAAMKDALQ